MKRLSFACLFLLAVACQDGPHTAPLDLGDVDLPHGGDPGPAGPSKVGIHVVLGVGTSTVDDITVTKTFCSQYTRLAVQVERWPYEPKEYNQHVAAGMKVLLNLSWQASPSGAMTPFPTDMTAYASQLDALLGGITPPELVFVENEEINHSFHSGPISDYLNEVKTASPIVHAHGLKLANGGIYGQGLYVLVYRWLDKTYGRAVADEYGMREFTAAGLNNVRNVGANPTMEMQAANVQAVLDAAPYLDYINIHHYEVDNPNVTDPASLTVASPVVARIKEFIETTTGKPMISNEVSIRENDQPGLVTSFMKQFTDLQLPYVLWWDNVDGNQYKDSPLNEGVAPFTLRPNGVAFQAFVKQHGGVCP